MFKLNFLLLFFVCTGGVGAGGQRILLSLASAFRDLASLNNSYLKSVHKGKI